MALGMLINGKWTTNWTEHDEQGNFIRMETKFNGTPESITLSDKKRYSLYISYGCPWATRTAIALNLLGLKDFINLIVVAPHVSKDGWYFTKELPDTNYDSKLLQSIYLKHDPNYTGRVTVPILWDGKKKKIINNESLEIMQILENKFSTFGKFKSHKLFSSPSVDTEIEYNYHAINNACYRVGFAKSQDSYDKEVNFLFKELDLLNIKLSKSDFLLGDTLTAADICIATESSPIRHFALSINAINSFNDNFPAKFVICTFLFSSN